MSDWVDCPVCGASDMQKTPDPHEPEFAVIMCVNYACASNGGNNADALLRRAKPEIKVENNRPCGRPECKKSGDTLLDCQMGACTFQKNNPSS